MKTKPVRIGIVGCGNVLGAYMPAIEALQRRGLAQAVAACSRQAAKRQIVLDEYGIGNFTTDYRELIQSDKVDLVLVLTSFDAHAPVARAALEAGKHVLLEKPMALTLEDAARLLELAKTSPGYLVCAPFVSLSPTYQIIAKRLRRGDIGRVLTARARYGWSGPWWNPWVYRPGGGALLNLGPYPITTLTGLLGPAKRVTAMTGIAIPEREVEGADHKRERIRAEVDDNAQVVIDFGEATFAVVTAGYTMQKYKCPAVELYGTTGTIQMLGNDWAPEGYELWQNEIGAWQYYYETDPSWNWTDGLRHAVECIHNNTRPIVTPEQAYHVLEIMLKAQEAGHDGQTRQIESTFVPAMFETELETEAAHLVHDPRRQK